MQGLLLPPLPPRQLAAVAASIFLEEMIEATNTVARCMRFIEDAAVAQLPYIGFARPFMQFKAAEADSASFYDNAPPSEKPPGLVYGCVADSVLYLPVLASSACESPELTTAAACATAAYRTYCRSVARSKLRQVNEERMDDD